MQPENGCLVLFATILIFTEEKIMNSREGSEELRKRRYVSNSLLPELWLFVRSSGKWWLVPVLVEAVIQSSIKGRPGATDNIVRPEWTGPLALS